MDSSLSICCVDPFFSTKEIDDVTGICVSTILKQEGNISVEIARCSHAYFCVIADSIGTIFLRRKGAEVHRSHQVRSGFCSGIDNVDNVLLNTCIDFRVSAHCTVNDRG